MKVALVMNSASGGGRALSCLPQLFAQLKRGFGDFELRCSSRMGEAREHARVLAEQGTDLIIAAGGDGTVSEVANAILLAKQRPELGVLPFGAGCDFARSLGVSLDPLEAVNALTSGRTRSVDAGRISLLANADRAPRHFVNVSSVGISADVGRAVAATRRPGRKPSYLRHAIGQLIRFRMRRLRITFDDAEVMETKAAMIAVANGRYFGGGMMVAPGADLDDGAFDVTIVHAHSKIGLLHHLGAVYSGELLNLPFVTTRRAARVEIEPLDVSAEHLVERDGDVLGYAPVRFDLLAGALTVRA